MTRAEELLRPSASTGFGVRRSHRIRLSRRSRTALFALAVLVAAVMHPARGLGISICLLKRQFGIQCPGCGLMRSLSCAIRGRWLEAWHYNAFGPLLLVVLVGLLLYGVVPEGVARRLAKVGARHMGLFQKVCWITVAAFLAHGVIRAVTDAMT